MDTSTRGYEMRHGKMKDFRKIIIESFKMGFENMKKDDLHHIEEIADLVLGEFRGKNIVDDDDVNPQIRDILYMLEAMDVLKMKITEKHIIDGRVWRNHYWVLNSEHLDEIKRSQRSEKSNESTMDDACMIYNRLPEEIWVHKDHDQNSKSV